MDKKDQPLTAMLKRYKGAFVVVGQVLMLALAINLFFVPKIQDIFDLREEIAKKSEESEKQSSYLSYLKSLQGVSLNLEGEVVHYALPSKNDVISLIVTYEGLGGRSGVQLSPLELTPGLISNPTVEEVSTTNKLLNAEGVRSTIKKQVAIPQAGVQSLSFDGSVVASNAETASAFINDIYRTRRLFNIERISWKTNKDETVTLTITFQTYYYPDTSVKPSEQLVRQGQLQEDFIKNLQNSVVYEEYVLDAVQVGHDDLFQYGSGTFLPSQDLQTPSVNLESNTTDASKGDTTS